MQQQPAAAAAAASQDRPHSLQYPNGIKLQETLGYDKLFSLKKSLETLGAPPADREHVYYPRILDWLSNGLEDGTQVSAADVVRAADELSVRKNRGGHPLNALFSFVRQVALRRAEREESQHQAELTARRQTDAAAERRTATRVASYTAPQIAPPEFRAWQAKAARLSLELRAIGRSPRDLPLDPHDWPETYLKTYLAETPT